MQSIELTPSLFHGAADIQFHDDGSLQPWRLKLGDLALHYHSLDGSIVQVAAHPSGVRLVFRCSTRRVRLVAEPLDGISPYNYDLFCDGTLIAFKDLRAVVQTWFGGQERCTAGFQWNANGKVAGCVG